MDEFWSSPRLSGAVIVGGTILLVTLTVPFYVRGSLHATSAQFRGPEAAAGNVRSLQVSSLGQGAWTIMLLAAFTILAVELVELGYTLLPALATVALVVFSTAWLIEASFHVGVTAWAARQIEQDAPVPELYHQLRRWLNLWLQVLANPLAFLGFVGFGVASLQAGVLAAWAAWLVIVWSAAAAFVPYRCCSFRSRSSSASCCSFPARRRSCTRWANSAPQAPFPPAPPTAARPPAVCRTGRHARFPRCASMPASSMM